MADITTLVQKYKARMVAGFRGTCVELSTRTIVRTPVDTGNLRRSWTPDKNAVDGSSRGGSVAAVTNSLDLGDSYSLATGELYARRIEYEGHSKQAPNGMVGPTVAEFQQIATSNFRGS